MRAQPIVFGVVGGIGAGKSFTTAAFRARGAACFDADVEARRLFDVPTLLDALRQRWGTRVVPESGEVDRRKLAEIVFAPTDAGRAELDFLNATIRPFLFSRFRNWLEEIRAAGRELAVLDAPLLFEVGWTSAVDYVVFVDASRTTRLRRVARRGWNAEELARREATQTPLDEKKARADFVVSADVDDSQMNAQVGKILDEIQLRDAKNQQLSVYPPQ